MKKFVVALALVGGVAVIAYASLSDRSYTKKTTEKQQKQEMKKKECKRSCLFG
jgi:16S rRNA C1402 N4-methylase RsmH